MPSVLEVLVPKQANNDYRGGAIPFYGFCLLFAQNIFSSTVHLWKHDSGKNSIGGMVRFEGTPDPNEVIYAFGALAGAYETLFVLLWVLVLWRYRNLIPLMLGFVLMEMLLRVVVRTLHPLGPEYFEHTAPATLALVPILLFSALMLFLAIRRSAATGTELDNRSGAQG